MLLWHLGGTVLIARYVFKDAAMDLRWLMLGALLPDLIDKPIGSLLFVDTFDSHRLWGHTMLFPVVMLAVAMLAFRRGSAARKNALAVVLGVFIHLLLDGAWLRPEGFLWPLFGFDFPRMANHQLGELVRSMITNPMVIAGEVFGLAYLVLLWWRYLREPGGVARFMRRGRIPLRP